MSAKSFLPEDYLAQRAERRTNLISLVLFAVVMTAVFAAFLVTNRQWRDVTDSQRMINARYSEGSQQIHELTELERQRDEMLNKAELAAALVERVPRSILLAELINRMPEQLGLLEFEVNSVRRQAQRPAAKATASRLSRRERGRSREEAEEPAQRIQPPRYRVSLAMVGLAPTDLEVSRYLSALNNYALLRDVTLVYSEQREYEGRTMRQFRISMDLVPDADVRRVDPLLVPRGVRDPMSDTLLLQPPEPHGSGTAQVSEN